MKNFKTYLIGFLVFASFSIAHSNSADTATTTDDCQEASIKKEKKSLKTILVEVDYVIDEMGKPYVIYINSKDYKVNQRVINMIEQAEWPIKRGDIETVHSMVINLEY